MLVAQLLALSSMFLPKCGQTKTMWLLIGNFIVASLRRLTTFLPIFSLIIHQKPGFSCGCQSKMMRLAALKLWTETGVRVLPGSYLGQVANEQNPGSGYIRVALVAPKEEMQRGLTNMRDCLYK